MVFALLKLTQRGPKAARFRFGVAAATLQQFSCQLVNDSIAGMRTEINKKDSNEINFFHGIHSGRETSNQNYTDASKPMPEGSRPSMPWRKSPTTIDTPRNPPPRQRNIDPGNSFKRMSSRPHQTSNPVSSKTVVAHSTKRRKLDSVTKKEMGSSPSNEVIILEDEDSPLSTDPIALVPSLKEAPNPFLSAPQNILSPKADRPYKPPRRSSVDGPEYSRVKEAQKPVQLAPESDDIEPADYPYFGPERIKTQSYLPPGVKYGNVKEKIEKFGPIIVFSKQGSGVAKNMKARNPRSNIAKPPVQKDPIANTISLKSTKQTKHHVSRALPIEEVYIGRMLITNEDRKSLKLVWNGTDLLIRERAGEMPERTLLALENTKAIGSCQYTAWKPDQSETLPEVVCLDFKILKGERLEEFRPYFAQGSDDQRGSITIKMSTSHPEWSGEIYGDFLERIKSHKYKSTEVNKGNVLWEIAARDVEISCGANTEHPAGKNKPDSNGQILFDTNNLGHSLVVPKPRPTIKKPNLKDIEKLGERSDSSKSGTVIRRSNRLADQDCLKAIECPPNNDELILVYPRGASGAVNITNGDLARLEPDEFLNDTLIEFGLKLWLASLPSNFAESIHVFSSFFYKKLNAKNGYQSVRKWTSKIDIFKKKYIIIPINENLHWYLAIIDHPEHTLNSPVPKPPVNTRSRAKKPEIQSASASIVLATPDDATFPGEPSVGSTPSEDRDVAEVVEDLTKVTPTSPVVENFHPKTVQNAVNKQPDEDVMIVDSQDEMTVLPAAITSKSTTADTNSLFDNDIDVEMSSADGSAVPLRKCSRETQDIEALESLSIDEGRGNGRSGVSPTRFYASKKGKGKEIAPPPEPAPEPLRIESEREESEIETEDVVPKTAIFTLDSLGSTQTKAAKRLQKYLEQEAEDKKDLKEIRMAVQKPALVPVQPNHSDCGIYLLHFAETFIRDPEKYHRIICSSKKPKYTQKQAKLDWNHAEVEGKREQLKKRILEESEKWKSTKEEQMKRDLAEGKVPEKVDVDDGRDSDVDIIDDVKVKTSLVKPKSKTRPTSKAAARNR